MRLIALPLLVAACAPIGYSPEKKDEAPAADAGNSKPVDAGMPDGMPQDGMPALTATWFLDNWEVKNCAAAFACRNNFPNDTGQTFTEAYGQNQTDCKAILLSYDMPATVEMEVAAGRIILSPTQAQTCISSFAYTCNTYWNEGPTYTGTSCPNALVGTVQNGGNCLTTWQCQNWTSYCDPNTHRCTAG